MDEDIFIVLIVSASLMVIYLSFFRSSRKLFAQHLRVLYFALALATAGIFIAILYRLGIRFELAPLVWNSMVSAGTLVLYYVFLKTIVEAIRRVSNYQMVLSITRELYSSKLSDALFQRIIELCVKGMAGAERGTVLRMIDGSYVYVAAVGYDLEKLKSVSIPETLGVSLRSNPGIIENIYGLNINFPERTKKILGEVNSDIRKTLMSRVVVNGETYMTFCVDSTKKNSFHSGDIEAMKLLSENIQVFIEKSLLIDKLEDLYQTDPLTKLRNRNALKNLREGDWSSVIFFDLDGLKRINDTYDHDAGDAVLMRLAQIIRNVSRKEDISVRMGGDEFMIIQKASPDEAKAVAERIRTQFSSPFDYKGKFIKPSATYGIASAPETNGDLKETIKLADQRMYSFKSSNRPSEPL